MASAEPDFGASSLASAAALRTMGERRAAGGEVRAAMGGAAAGEKRGLAETSPRGPSWGAKPSVAVAVKQSSKARSIFILGVIGIPSFAEISNLRSLVFLAALAGTFSCSTSSSTSARLRARTVVLRVYIEPRHTL